MFRPCLPIPESHLEWKWTIERADLDSKTGQPCPRSIASALPTKLSWLREIKEYFAKVRGDLLVLADLRTNKLRAGFAVKMLQYP